MKKILILLIVLLLSNISTFADVFTERYIAITDTSCNLTLESNNKLNCEGFTQTQRDYTAGVKIELQQYDTEWTTIKIWEDITSSHRSYISKPWYVESGYQYRLKVTHTAYDSDLETIETVISYSRIVEC